MTYNFSTKKHGQILLFDLDYFKENKHRFQDQDLSPKLREKRDAWKITKEEQSNYNYQDLTIFLIYHVISL